jgi:hypothetical protein
MAGQSATDGETWRCDVVDTHRRPVVISGEPNDELNCPRTAS